MIFKLSVLPPIERYAPALVTSATEALVAISNEGLILYWNWGAELLFGVEAAQATGKHLPELVAEGEQANALRQLLTEAAQTGSAVGSLEGVARGLPVNLEVFLKYVPQVDDQAGWIAFAAKDHTEHERLMKEVFTQTWGLEKTVAEKQKLEQTIRDQHQALLQRHAVLADLAARVSHNLKNPFAGIRSAAHYVLKRLGRSAVPAGDAKVTRFLELIGLEIDASSRLIDDLLLYARPQPPVQTECPVPQLVEQAVAQQQIPPNVELELRVSEALPIPRVDRLQIQRAIASLIQNAIEAIPPQRSGKVVVAASAVGGELVIRVEDDGVGVALEHRSSIFDPLYTTKLNGAGLGLAIAARIAVGHGGTVELGETAGAGAAFVIRLPV